MQQRLWNALWQRAADVSTVVFDIGGTLLDWNPQKVKALLPEAYRERLFHALFVPDHTWRWSAFDLGAVPQEEAAANIAREEGLPQCEQAVLDALNGFWRSMTPLPLSECVLPLRREGKRLLALSNYPWPQIGQVWERYDFFRLFDGRVVSACEKCCKPEERIFSLLLTRFSLRAEDCLFLDDALENTRAAARLGFHVWQDFAAEYEISR